MLNVINNVSQYIQKLPPVGVCIAFMLIESVLFVGYAFYMDSLSVISVEPSVDPSFNPAVLDGLDDDVQAERDRVLGNVVVTTTAAPNYRELKVIPDNVEDTANVRDDPLVISRLRKVFPPKVTGRTSVIACEDLTFSVGRGEIFGLLGANGAGKTTALSMLTRLLIPTSGDATIMQRSILSSFPKAASHLGVVTQNNSLWDRLTVEDHLFLFARLRGVPEDLVVKMVEGTIDQLELSPHRKKLSMTLSGGMKRKLCVAIALIGDPEVVLLDEPSAGLDPVSRRNLWTVIMRTMSTRSVILTTHSMEEAEALCKRIGIMVRGQLRALGTKQRLKNKFGSGFELTMKIHIHDIDKQRTDITAFVQSLFPSAFILNENGGLFTFQIPKEEMSIGLVFTQLEERKAELFVEDYTFAQPTLEQVFIRTVNKHTPTSTTVVPTHPNTVVEEIFYEVNKCGCTDFTTKVIIFTTFGVFVLFMMMAIAVVGRSNKPLSSSLTVVGFISLFACIISFCLLCCACCKPPKGQDE
jgi:ABC-type multidrug transport system ATPase subunit